MPGLQPVFICMSVSFRAGVPTGKPENEETRGPHPGSVTN